MDRMLRQQLVETAKLLNRTGVRWGLGGSAMLSFYGLADQPQDLDLMVAEEDADAAVQALNHLGVLAELAPKPPFCSRRFLRQKSASTGIETDVIATFRIKHGDGVYEYALKPYSVTRVEPAGDTVIPLTAPEDWFVLYLLMGREDRADRIGVFLRQGGMAHPELLQEALQREVPEAIRRRIHQIMVYQT